MGPGSAIIYFTGVHMGVMPSQPTQTEGINPGQPGHGMVLKDVTHIGDKDEVFRMVWERNDTGVKTFGNGQQWKLAKYVGDGDPKEDFDDASWVTVSDRLVPKDDLVAGLGSGPNHIVLEDQENGKHVILGSYEIKPGDDVIPGPASPEKPKFDDLDHAFCFGRGTLIETPTGPRLIEDLRVGDLVLTKDNGAQPVRWIGSRMLRVELMLSPKLRPIRIRAGALGNGTPTSDLIVSPQHRVLVRSRVARRMFDTDEILVAAKQLLQLDGIDIAEDMQEVEYFHILFDQHEVVVSNGAETESFYPGPQGLKSVGHAAQKEIFALFPELRDHDYRPEPARVLPAGRMSRKLAMRHLQHARPLVSEHL